VLKKISPKSVTKQIHPVVTNSDTKKTDVKREAKKKNNKKCHKTNPSGSSKQTPQTEANQTEFLNTKP